MRSLINLILHGKLPGRADVKIQIGPDQYLRLFMFPFPFQCIVEEEKHNIL